MAGGNRRRQRRHRRSSWKSGPLAGWVRRVLWPPKFTPARVYATRAARTRSLVFGVAVVSMLLVLLSIVAAELARG